jgi:hypothetical protein
LEASVLVDVVVRGLWHLWIEETVISFSFGGVFEGKRQRNDEIYRYITTSVLVVHFFLSTLWKS